MDRRDEPRYPRSTKDDLLNEGRGVEAPVGAAGGAGLGNKAEEDIKRDRRTDFDRNR